MVRQALIFFFISIGFLSHARELARSIDSLDRLIADANIHSTEMAKLFKTKAAYYFEADDWETSAVWFKKSAAISEQNADWEELEDSYSQIYACYEKGEQWDSVLFWANRAQLISDKFPGQLHNNLCSVGYAYQRLNLLDSAELYFLRCARYRQQFETYTRLLESYGNLQYLYRIRNQHTEEYKILEEKIQLCKANQDNYHLSDALYSKGVFLSFLDDSSTVSTYNEALKISLQSNNLRIVAKTLTGIGEVLYSRRLYAEALSYFQRALDVSEENEDLKSLGFACLSIGDCLTQLKEFDSANFYIDKGFEANKLSQYEHQLPYLYMAKGNLHKEMGSWEAGLDAVDKGIAIANKLLNWEIEFDLTTNRIKLLLQKGDVTDAKRAMVRLFDLAEKIDTDLIRRKYYETAYSFHEELGLYHEALDDLKQLRELDAIIAAKALDLKVIILGHEFKIEQKQQENEYLKLTNESQHAQIRFQSISLSLVIVILILMIFLSWNLYVTRARRIEYTNELEKYNADIKEINDNKDTLFKIISHDLRGPVGNISNALLIMEELVVKGDMEGVRKLLQIITAQGKSTVGTLNNLLQWAKSQQDAIVIKIEPNDLHLLIVDVCRFFQSGAALKNINLHHHVPQPCMALFDRDMIEAVIRNLLANALKFTQSFGSVYVEVKEDKDHWLIQVKDSGLGMTEDRIQEILDKTSFTPTWGTNKEKGSGIGIKVCMEFIERHNSELAVSSELGKGSVFFFRLPMA